MSIGKKETEPYFTNAEAEELLSKVAPEILLDDTVRGVSVKELAKHARVSLGTVRGWERRGELPEPIGRRRADGYGGVPQYLYDGCIVAPMRVRVKRKEKHEPLWLRRMVSADVKKRRQLVWPPLWSAQGVLLDRGSAEFRYRACVTGRWKGRAVGMRYMIEHTKRQRKTRQNRDAMQVRDATRNIEVRAAREKRRAVNRDALREKVAKLNAAAAAAKKERAAKKAKKK